MTTLGSGAVTWKSQRSEVVALSTAGAEYYAAGQVGREVVYLRQLLSSLGFEQDGPTRVGCDNQAAIAITHNPEFHARTKHIDLRHHWLREQVAKGTMRLHYVATEENSADIMTKALSNEKHRQPASVFQSSRQKWECQSIAIVPLGLGACRASQGLSNGPRIRLNEGL